MEMNEKNRIEWERSQANARKHEEQRETKRDQYAEEKYEEEKMHARQQGFFQRFW